MNKFGKIFTIAISAFALTASTATVLVMTLDDTNVASLSADEIRYYSGSYYSEGSLFYETGSLKKGDLINLPSLPTKDTDADGTVWQFLGWDIDNNGIVDVLGDRIYFNFEAHAVYFKVPIPDEFTLTAEQIQALLDIITSLDIQLTPEQIERLIEILKGIDIDWSSIDENILEQLLNFLGMDLEELMELLGLDLEDLLGMINAPVFEFTASDYSLPAFFRTTSYKDFKGNQWTNPDYYPTNRISQDSINPLGFAADKISKLMNPTHFDITYLKNGKKYPVPAYELYNSQNLDSEAYSLTNPTPNPTEEHPKASSYSTDGFGFYPASAYTVGMLDVIEFSNNAITQDEIAYRDFAYSNYLNVDEKYSSYFKSLALENEIVVDSTYSYISKINEIFKGYSLKDLNTEEMVSYPEGVDQVLYFMQEAKTGLADNFAEATTLFYRSLGVPARYVEGYFSYPQFMEGPPYVVGGLFAHSWTEIYIDGIGWLMTDTSILNALPPELSSFLFDSPDVVIDDLGNRKLDHIELSVSKERYFIGQHFDEEDLTITAFYDNNTTAIISKELQYDKENTLQTLSIFVQDFSTLGEKVIKVFYSEKGIPATDTITVEVVEPVLTSLKVVEDSYQSKYLLGNKLDIENIKFKGYFDDGSIVDFEYEEVVFVEEINLSVVGEMEYHAYVPLFEDVKAVVPITVLKEPDTPLVGLKNNRTIPYKVYRYSENVDYLNIDMTATYEDNTYRDISDETGTYKITGGDFDTLGIQEVTFTYTERGVSVSIIILIEVVIPADDIIFDIANTKEYDGESFDFSNIITPTNEDHTPFDAFGEGERIETKIYYSSLPEGEDFIDVGTCTFFVKMRIINDNGAILTDDYFAKSNVIHLRLAGEERVEEWQIGEDGFYMDEEGYIDLNALNFTINRKEIHIHTKNIFVDSQNIYYLDDGTYQVLNNRYDSVYFDETPANTDTLMYEELVFNTLDEDDTLADNKFDLSTIRFVDEARGVDTTKNYKIIVDWGTLRRN